MAAKDEETLEEKLEKKAAFMNSKKSVGSYRVTRLGTRRPLNSVKVISKTEKKATKSKTASRLPYLEATEVEIAQIVK